MPASISPPTRDEILTPNLALSLPAVFRSVSIISSTISQLPLQLEQNGTKADRQPSTVIRPDFSRSRRDYISRAVVNMVLLGEAFILVTYDTKNQPKNFECVANSEVSIHFHEKTGEKTFEYRDRKYSMREMKHLRPFQTDGVHGIGPIQAARQTLTGYVRLQRHSANFLTDGGVPTGILNWGENASQEMIDAAQERWEEMLADHTTPILPNGFTYQSLSLSPADLAYLDQMEYSVTDIARLFGVPASYLLASIESGSSLTYQTIRDVDIQFHRTTLMPYMAAIEDAMSSAFGRNSEIRFDLSEWLRPDDKTRFESYKLGLDAGWLTVNEVREREFLPPLPAQPEPEEIEPEVGEDE